MFRKNPFRRIIPPFFFESAESGRFFDYLHDSNSIFWAQGIKSEWVLGRTVRPLPPREEIAGSSPASGTYSENLTCSCEVATPCRRRGMQCDPKTTRKLAPVWLCVTTTVVPTDAEPEGSTRRKAFRISNTENNLQSSTSIRSTLKMMAHVSRYAVAINRHVCRVRVVYGTTFGTTVVCGSRLRGVTVSTLDSQSSNHGSNPREVSRQN